MKQKHPAKPHQDKDEQIVAEDFYTSHDGLTRKREGSKAGSVNNSSRWLNSAGQEVNGTIRPTLSGVWEQAFSRRYSPGRGVGKQGGRRLCTAVPMPGGAMLHAEAALPVLACNLAKWWFLCPLPPASARHIVTAAPHTEAKQGEGCFPKEDLFSPSKKKEKKKNPLDVLPIYISKWRANSWLGPSQPSQMHFHALSSSGLEPGTIAAMDGSTYDSWRRPLCEELNQAAGKSCPFPTELHSLTAAKTLSTCRELSFTDACEFSIASILRNWLYPGRGEQGNNMPWDLPKVTSLIYWRAWNGGTGSYSFD